MSASNSASFAVLCSGPKPPAPVAPFRGQERFARFLQGGFRLGRPRSSLFYALRMRGRRLRAHPTIIPHAATSSAWPIHTSKFALIHDAGKIPVMVGISLAAAMAFARGLARGEILIGLDASVKLAQERATVPWVVFPGIFAIEEKTNRQGLIALYGFSEMTHSTVEIRRGGFRLHAAVNEADQV